MSPTKGAAISIETTTSKTIINFLKKCVDKQLFDAVILPMQVPSNDSYAYVLIKDKNLMDKATPLPPTMFVQGAKALSSITRLGEGNLKIAAILRPCEIRAVNELVKLGQINLTNITLISMDCPGVLPTKDFLKDPEKYTKRFHDAVTAWDDTIMRPVCQICDKSSMIAGDIHIGTHGAKKDTIFVIPATTKGQTILTNTGIKTENTLDSWKKKVTEISDAKRKIRIQAHKTLKTDVGGIDNLVDTFSQCINCHNCMRVCPVCICRLCYFDSDKVKHGSDEYLQQAEAKGSMRFLPDTTLFQMGRMMHMSISCVSCGSCSDACPVSIPVAQVFSMIADETQNLFQYISGENRDDPIPLVTYKEEELHEMEDTND